MDISESIRTLRESNDMTQEQFGQIAGVSAMAVSQWENGRAVPRMGSIQKLSSYFGVPKSRIMGDVQYAIVKLDDDDENCPSTDDERELVALYRRMADDDKSTFLDMARALAIAGDAKKKDVDRAVGTRALDAVR